MDGSDPPRSEVASELVQSYYNATLRRRTEPSVAEPRGEVVAGLLRPLVTAAQLYGVDATAELAKLGLDISILASPDARVPYATLMALVDRLAERSGEPNFGLRVAEAAVDAASYGMLGFAARAAPTLRSAIESVARHAPLMNENTRILLSEVAGGLRVDDGPIPPLVWPRHYSEQALASFVILGRRWTGVEFSAVEVVFRHPRPSSTREHEIVFGCTPRFDGDSNYVVIPAHAIDLPFSMRDDDLSAVLATEISRRAAQAQNTPRELVAVQVAIERRLEASCPTIEWVARDLGMSERTLQRRLEEHGTTFSEVLDSVRCETALAALGDPRASVQELAAKCGFVDLKAFRRAFRRWTGTTPARYRGSRQ